MQRKYPLGNAIRGTEYTDENEIEVITLKDVIFIGYHNDVSLFFDSRITLWEHQSTVNKNMPLRGLIHYVQCVDGYLEKRNLKKKIYRKAIVKIPAPDYYVLYNGTEEAPDRQEMHLSDAADEAIERCINEGLLKEYLLMVLRCRLGTVN